MNGDLIFTEPVSVWINGVRAGAVESWSAVSERQFYAVESMEEQLPKALLPYGEQYRVTLTRLFLDGGVFFALSGFRLMLQEGDRRILFSGCEWQEIEEKSDVHGPITVWAVLTAKNREDGVQ